MLKKNSIIILIGSLLILTGILGRMGVLHFVSDFITFDEISGTGVGVIGVVLLWVSLRNVRIAKSSNPVAESELNLENEFHEDANLESKSEPGSVYEFNEDGNLKLPVKISCANCGDSLTIKDFPYTCSCGCAYNSTLGGLEWSVGHGFNWRTETRTKCPHCESVFSYHTYTTLNTNKTYCTKCNFSRYESD